MKKKKRKEKNCKDLGFGQELMKFRKILMPKSLKNFNNKKKKHTHTHKGILGILTGFNGKS
jgi:hypothetical protein